jgi:hypothetical protein
MTAGFFVRRRLPLSASWPGLSRPSTSCFDQRKKDVDARAKRGHDEGCPLSLRGALATKQSSLGLGLLGRSFRSGPSHRKIRAKEVDKCNHDGHGKQYAALLQDHVFTFHSDDGPDYSTQRCEASL